ncbi:delta-60 repeat domain-containing protein [Pseudomonas farris]
MTILTDKINLKSGQFDPTFGIEGVVSPTLNGADAVRSIVVGDNEELICAFWTEPKFSLCRYHADGNLDRSFGQDGVAEGEFEKGLFSSQPVRLLLQKNERKILLIGGAQTAAGNGHIAITRFNENGSPDLVFGSKVLPFPQYIAQQTPFEKGCIVQDDGKILLSYGYSMYRDANLEYRAGLLIRLTNQGELDLDFGFGRGFVEVRFYGQNTTIRNIGLLSDGSIIAGGDMSIIKDGSSPSRMVLARFKANGMLDSTFADDGYATLNVSDHTNESFYNFVVHEDKLICVGLASRNDYPEAMLTRLNQDGTSDMGFNYGNPVYTRLHHRGSYWQSLAIQSDNKILVGGSDLNGQDDRSYWGRFNNDGTPDTSFGESGINIGPLGMPWQLVVQNSKNRIVIAAEGRESGRRVPKMFGIEK